MLGLVICCIILSVLFIIIDFLKGQIGWGILWIFILGMNINSCVTLVKENKEKELNGDVETYVIKDVKGIKMDTTTVISGTDTTRTYVLTYWK
jgi:hypothetical protein